MDINKLIEFSFRFEGQKVAIFGTGTGAIKVVNGMGVLFKDVVCFFESNPKKSKFLGKSVYKINQNELDKIDALIIASEYYEEIKILLSAFTVKNLYFPFNDGVVSIEERATKQERIENGTIVGKRTYTTKNTIHNSVYLNTVKSIGAFTSINAFASIGGDNHPTNFVSTHPHFYLADDKLKGEKNEYLNESKDILEFHQEIIIGNDVWIATNAIILPGVTIGDGAVIGAGAVVTKDIPPYAIAVGVPAKVIKYRFSEKVIEGLLKIQWWNWPDEKIKDNIELFYDPEKFVETFLKEIE